MELYTASYRVVERSMDGVWFKKRFLKAHKQRLCHALRELHDVQTANCGYIKWLCHAIHSTNKRLKALAVAIAAEGPALDTPHAPDFLSTRKYPYVGDDSYQQLLRNAISRIDAIMTRQLDRCDELCCELPKPDFIEVSRNPDSRTEKKSLLIRPAAKEQKLYEQALRVARGNKKLLPICFEICHMQQQARKLLQVIDMQGAAMVALFPRLTAKGVHRLLCRIKSHIPERLFTELSIEVHEQVDWVFRNHGRGYFTDISATSTSCLISVVEEPRAIQLQEGTAAGDGHDTAATTTPKAVVTPAVSSGGDASCNVTPGSRRTGTGKTGLGKAMKWLCVGLASNVGKLAKGAGKAAVIALKIGKLHTAAAAA